MTFILHSKPWITEEDRRAVDSALASGMIGQGERTRELERRLGAWVAAEDGVAVASGSAALVLALNGVGAGPGDEVILPSYVCASVLEAVLSVGAEPVLCDVGEDWIVTVAQAEACLTAKTKAVIVPHMYGVFADVPAFRELGIAVIEDCAQAIADYGARTLLADVAVFSLHPTKCLTAGEGGVAVSSRREVLDTMRAFRDGAPGAPAGRLFSPLSDISAALALAQLARFPEILRRRREIAGEYLAALGPAMPAGLNRRALGRSMFFRFPVRAAGGLDAWGDRFREAGVLVRRGVDALLHRRRKLPDAGFPTAVALYNSTVSLPLYPALTPEQVRHCIQTAVQLFSRTPSPDDQDRRAEPRD